MRKCLWLYLLLVLPLVVVGCKGMKGGDPDADACAACGACGDACSDASACGGCGEGCGCGDAEAGAMLQDGDAEEDFDLDRISEDMLAEKERIGALKTRLVALAERARNSGQLVQAREIYRKVVQLDPGDATARDALFRLSEELGERGATAEGILEGASTREGARREQVAEMIRNRITKARVAEDENDYDEAIRNYQEIINLLGWYPYQADLPVDEGGARALLDEARKRKELYDERRSAALRRQVQAEEEARRRRAQTETADQIRTFLRLASDAYDAGNYILAINYAERVRALDPRNEAAINLVKIAKETKYVADSNATKEHFAHEWKLIMERLELSAIPQSDIMRFPRNWSMIASRTARTGVGMDDSAAEDPRTQQILNVLQTRRVGELNLKPGEITLEGAIEYLRSVTGENFVISQKVRDEKSDIELDLEVKDVTVAQVLNLITEPHDMAWKIRNGVVMVLDISEATEDLILQFFDVKDLVARISDFPGEEINLFPSKYTPPEPDEGDEPEPPFNADQLIELVRNTIEPESWDAIEGVAIEAKNNILVIKTTREIQRKVGALLDDLRKHTGILINIEVRFLDAEDRFLRDVGVDMRGLGDQTGGVGIPGKGSAPNFDDSFVGTTANPAGTGQGVIPEPSSIGTSPIPGAFFGDGTDGTYQGRVENLFDMILQFREPGQATQSAQQGGLRGANAGGFTLQTTFIDDVQFEVILRAVQKSERIEQISAPSLTVYNTQRANVSVLTQNSYVADFDVEIAQAAAIGDPIVQTIRDGVILDVRPIVSADRRFITMELRPTVAELVRPIPTFLTSLATGPPVTIQVPEIAIKRVRTTVTMPDGGMLLLGGIKFFADKYAESGLPIASKIPIISFLVTRKAKTIQRGNLLILVKAKIVILDELEPKLGLQ